MKNTQQAFTMIELVFVIVVLGILSAIAIPRFSATRTDAQISKARADIASIRSGIITERQSRLITGTNSFISTANMDNGGLFGGVLTYPITSATTDGHWERTATDVNTSTYVYRVNGNTNQFKYTASSGIFTCVKDATAPECADLTD